MERDKGDISKKLCTEYICFCLEQKLNKTEVAWIRNILLDHIWAIFEYINRNIRAYPRSKRIYIDQWLGKYYCILQRIRAKWGVGEEVWFVPNTDEWSGV